MKSSTSWRTPVSPRTPDLNFELVFRFEVRITFEVVVRYYSDARAARQGRFRGGDAAAISDGSGVTGSASRQGY